MVNSQPFSSSTRGFSLLELTVVIGIIALIIGMSLTVGQKQVEQAEVANTYNELQAIDIRLKLFAERHKRVPYPAPLNAAQGNAEYGNAAQDCTATGLERVEYPASSGQYVCLGAIPFHTLGMSEKFIDDEWEGRYFYAVTEAAATQIDHSTEGNLHVKDGQGNTITDSALYVVGSHGMSQKGATDNKTGAIRIACDGNQLDKENCSFNGEFIDTRVNADTDTNLFYDDYVVWETPSNVVTQHTILKQYECDSGNCYNECVGNTAYQRSCTGPQTCTASTETCHAICDGTSTLVERECSGAACTETSRSNCVDQCDGTSFVEYECNAEEGTPACSAANCHPLCAGTTQIQRSCNGNTCEVTGSGQVDGECGYVVCSTSNCKNSCSGQYYVRRACQNNVCTQTSRRLENGKCGYSSCSSATCKNSCDGSYYVRRACSGGTCVQTSRRQEDGQCGYRAPREACHVSGYIGDNCTYLYWRTDSSGGTSTNYCYFQCPGARYTTAYSSNKSDCISQLKNYFGYYNTSGWWCIP